MPDKLRARPPALYVEWEDSAMSLGWGDEGPPVTLCRSLGWLVDRSDDAITLATSQASNYNSLEWGNLITIPRSAITRTRRVKVG